MTDDPHREAIARAEAMLASLAGQYLDVARQDLARLETATAALADDRDGRAGPLRRVFEIAHDMKGQGATFGYPLITKVCNGLCRFVERIDGPGTDAEAEVVARHVAAVRTILDDKLTDPDSERAKGLRADLEAAVREARG